MGDVHRAGGHIDRDDGKGWVVDDTPAPLPASVPHGKPTHGPTEVGGHRLTDEGWALTEPGEPYEARRPPPAPSKPAKKPAAKKTAKRKEK